MGAPVTRPMRHTAAVLAAALCSSCSSAVDIPPPSPQSAPVTVETTVDDLPVSPCDAFPWAARPKVSRATTGHSPGALVGYPLQQACTVEATNALDSRVVVLYRDVAPMRPLQEQQPTAQLVQRDELALVQFAVPTDNPSAGSTCVTVTDRGPAHGIGVIATITGHHNPDPCAVAQKALLAVIYHLARRIDELPVAGAPKVEFPLDTTRSENAPCDTLTEEQLTEIFGSAPVGKHDDVTGPTCRWRRDGFTANVTVNFTKITELGISNYYLGKDDGGLFLVLPPVGGYPAVAWGDDNRAEGSCYVAVGVTDRQVVNFAVEQSKGKVGQKDPCVDAHGIAEMVIGNIKGAN